MSDGLVPQRASLFFLLLVVVEELVESHLVAYQRLCEREVPLLDVHGLSVADRHALYEVLGVFLCDWIADILEIFVAAEGLMKIKQVGFVMVEFIENMQEFFFMDGLEGVECLLLRDDVHNEGSDLGIALAWLLAFAVFYCGVHLVHQQKQDYLEVAVLAGDVQRSISLRIAQVVLEVEALLTDHPKYLELVVNASVMGRGVLVGLVLVVDVNAVIELALYEVKIALGTIIQKTLTIVLRVHNILLMQQKGLQSPPRSFARNLRKLQDPNYEPDSNRVKAQAEYRLYLQQQMELKKAQKEREKERIRIEDQRIQKQINELRQKQLNERKDKPVAPQKQEKPFYVPRSAKKNQRTQFTSPSPPNRPQKVPSVVAMQSKGVSIGKRSELNTVRQTVPGKYLDSLDRLTMNDDRIRHLDQNNRIMLSRLQNIKIQALSRKQMQDQVLKIKNKLTLKSYLPVFRDQPLDRVRLGGLSLKLRGEGVRELHNQIRLEEQLNKINRLLQR